MIGASFVEPAAVVPRRSLKPPVVIEVARRPSPYRVEVAFDRDRELLALLDSESLSEGLLVGVFDNVLLVGLGVDLEGPALSLELLCLIELYDDHAFLVAVLRVQQLVVPVGETPAPFSRTSTLVGQPLGTPGIRVAGLFLEPGETRLRKSEFTEGAPAQLEAVEHSLGGEGLLTMDSLV
jgi:hypothetical protein